MGVGYVGQPLVKETAKYYEQIIGFDLNLELISKLNKENSLKNVNYSNNPSDLAESDVIVICVPTPLNLNRKPDLKFLEKACDLIATNITKSTLIINESTSFPGTLRRVVKNRVESKSEYSNYYASAPERIDPGNITWNLSNTPRLISGVDEKSTEMTFEFYSKICKQVIKVRTPEVAELSKLFENSFRQVNISLVNELAQISNLFGVTANEVVSAANTKPYGFMPFLPSTGVGGHCIPVDPSYLSFAVEELGGSADFIDLANKVNLDMPKYVAKRIEKDLSGLNNKKIQIAGISYKKGVSDLRESPALLLISELRDLGAKVIWHDPLVKEWSSEKSVGLNDQIDLGLIITPHAEIDFEPWKNGVRVFDLSATSQNFGWAKYL